MERSSGTKMSERILVRPEVAAIESARRVESFSRKRKSSSSMAQRRWRILARALTGSPERLISESDEETSVRRFSRFGLLKTFKLTSTLLEPDSNWYEYSAVFGNELFSVEIRHVRKNFTPNQLIGFNNTGNICVWPSEECLAYYLLKNRHICRKRRVLELGGGMSCLAGVLVGKYSEAKAVTLTDGNLTSVDNVRCIVRRNELGSSVECEVLQWAKAARALKHRESSANRAKRMEEDIGTTGGGGSQKHYDVILCADCLFFDEARQDLVETIYGWLTEDGIGLVMAPRRGSTFEKFTAAAIDRGLIARQIERYDNEVWSRHLELLEASREYSPDLHYPLLLQLSKQKKMPPG